MKYVLVSKEQARIYGFHLRGHMENGDNIVLNEKEILFSPNLKADTFPEKVKILGGESYSFSEIINIINKSI